MRVSWVRLVCMCAAALASGRAVAGSAVAAPTLSPALASALARSAFTAAPADLVAAGQVVDRDHWSELREDLEVSFDAQGRTTHRLRHVVARGEASDFTTLRVPWLGFRELQPTVRGRVIDAHGAVHDLDPALAVDTAALELPVGTPIPPGTPRLAGLPSALRNLTETLPAPRGPEVIEWESVTSQRAPLTPADVFAEAWLAPRAYAKSTTISAPRALHVRLTERDLPAGVHARHEVIGDREQWTYDVPAAPEAPALASEPNSEPTEPIVWATTAASWDAVARGYRAIVERQIAAGAPAWPAGIARTASVATVQALVAWLHHNVRDDHVGFGFGPVAPMTPAATASQGIADGKDRAALLVALLRAAGIRAEVAVVRSRRAGRRALDEAAPTLGQLDCVVVRARVRASELWIDPSTPEARPGLLDSELTGARGVVLAGEGHALITTPGDRASDHGVSEVRTFTLPEDGAARAREVIHYAGAFELSARRRIQRAASLDKGAAERAKRVFGAELEGHTETDVDDPVTPFQATLIMRNSGVAAAGERGIDVLLLTSSVLEEAARAVGTGPRHTGFSWPTPFKQQVEYRIVVPTGFAIGAQPADRTVALGPATFRELRRVEPPGADGSQTLSVTFQFDTGKPRLTAGEATALIDGLHALEAQRVEVHIPRVWWAQLAAGKAQDAFAEVQRLIALHPREGLHHAHLASVLIKLGLGDAARREARAAVAMSPELPVVHDTLGYVLSFDTVGRGYRPGWDRAGALAALRQARLQFPDHAGLANRLARVLERSVDGLQSSSAELEEALDLRRIAYRLAKTSDGASALAIDLYLTGAYLAAETAARAADPSQERNAMIVSAVAAQHGAPAAIAAADQLGGDRRALLSNAGWRMLELQRYDAARGLYAAAGSAPKLFGIDALAQMAAHPTAAAAPTDPKLAALVAVLALADSRLPSTVFWSAEDLAEERKNIDPERERFLIQEPQLFGDLWQSSASITVTGGDGAWRVAKTLPQLFAIYIVRDHGTLRVVGGSTFGQALGRYLVHVLDGAPGAPLDAARAAQAHQLLDWFARDRQVASPVFGELWPAGAPATRDAMQLAAAELVALRDPAPAIAIATRCASPVPHAAELCPQILFRAQRASHHPAEAVRALETAERLRPKLTLDVLAAHLSLLVDQQRLAEAERLLAAQRAIAPDDPRVAAGEQALALARADWPAVIRLGDVLAARPGAPVGAANNAAWYRLCAHTDLPAALATIRKANAREATDAALNTAAALAAELGELTAAAGDLQRSLAKHEATTPGDWYVLGRIAEQLGLRDDAAAAYRQVAGDGRPATPSALAHARLTALGVAP